MVTTRGGRRSVSTVVGTYRLSFLRQNGKEGARVIFLYSITVTDSNPKKGEISTRVNSIVTKTPKGVNSSNYNDHRDVMADISFIVSFFPLFVTIIERDKSLHSTYNVRRILLFSSIVNDKQFLRS